MHFQNTNGSAGTCTLVGDEGAFESPPLARGEGWHHRFDAPGRFPFRVSEMPSRRGVILVLPREPR